MFGGALAPSSPFDHPPLASWCFPCVFVPPYAFPFLFVHCYCRGIGTKGSLSTPVLGPKPKPRIRDHPRGGKRHQGNPR